MNQSSPLKKPANGFVGALAIAAGTQAYANPVSVTPPPDVNVAAGTSTFSQNWDVNSDGIMDFTINYRYPNAATQGVIWQANLNPFSGSSATNGVVSYNGAFIRYAFALTNGTPINAGSAFSTQTQITLGSRYNSGGIPTYYGGFAAGGPNGSVSPGTFAFAGFRFTAADGTHFGWINLSVGPGIIDFVSAAYESTPGTAIAAGTGGIPEPSTLAMLALGAAGVLGTAIKRRRA
jgi:hypothetical protein